MFDRCYRWNGNIGEVRPGELDVPLSLITPQKAELTAFLGRNEPALMTRDPLYQATLQRAAELEQAKKRLFQRINASSNPSCMYSYI